MRKQFKLILPLMIMVLFISCTEISEKVEDHLNDLTKKAESLDS